MQTFEYNPLKFSSEQHAVPIEYSRFWTNNPEDIFKCGL